MTGAAGNVGEPCGGCLGLGVAPPFLIGRQRIYAVPLGQVRDGRLVENVKRARRSFLRRCPPDLGSLHEGVVGFLSSMETSGNAGCAHRLGAERYLELDPALATRAGARDELYQVLGELAAVDGNTAILGLSDAAYDHNHLMPRCTSWCTTERLNSGGIWGFPQKLTP